MKISSLIVGIKGLFGSHTVLKKIENWGNILPAYKRHLGASENIWLKSKGDTKSKIAQPEH